MRIGIFNPSTSVPLIGGFFERLVCVIKMPLRTVLGRVLLGMEVLYTVLCEIEMAANNNRPT